MKNYLLIISIFICSISSAQRPETPCSPVTTSLSGSICSGNSYFFNGAYLTSAGNYYDTLSTTLGCDSILALTLSVNPSPSVSISASGNTSFCTGDSVRLTALGNGGSGGGSSILDQSQLIYNAGTSARTLSGYSVWQSFTAGITGTLNEIDMGFFNAINGVGTLKLFAGSGNAGTLLQSQTVNVICASGNCMIPFTVSAQVTAGQVYTFQFTPGAGIPDPYGVQAEVPGTYSGGQMGLVDPSGTSYPGFDLIFKTYVTSGPSLAYQWSTGSTNKAIEIKNTGNYVITVVDGNACSATAAQAVSATPYPAATISGSSEICLGNSLSLTANGGGSYQWANGLGNSAGISVSPTNNTTYTVTATSGNSCSATASKSVVVNQPAVSQINGLVCAGETYPFNGANLTQSGVYADTLQTIHGCDSVVTLNLSVRAAIKTLLSDSSCQGVLYTFNNHSYNQSGVYKDTLQSVTGCDSVVILNLYIDSISTPVITRNGDTLHTQNFAFYQWLLDGNAINNANQQSLVVNQNGNYSVVVSSPSGCSDTSLVLSVEGLSVADVQLNIGFKLYPNPNNGNFVLEFAYKGIFDVEVTDVFGKVIYSLKSVSSKQAFNLYDIAAGIYILRVNQNGKISSAKFTVVQ